MGEEVFLFQSLNKNKTREDELWSFQDLEGHDDQNQPVHFAKYR